MIGEVMLLPEKWKRKQGSGYLFFFVGLHSWPIFIFQPISSIFPGTAGTSRYDPVFGAERNSRVSISA